MLRVLLKPLVLFSVLAVHVICTADKMTLTVKPHRINAITTKTFSMKCDYSGGDQNIEISSVHLYKHWKSERKELASLRPESKILVVGTQPHANYTGHIGPGKAYLHGFWNTVVKFGIEGKYECDVKLTDKSKNVTIKKKTAIVTKHIATLMDAVRSIRELQRFRRKYEVQDLPLELSHLQVWTKKMAKTFSFLDRALMKPRTSMPHNRRYYVAYTFQPEPLQHSQADAFCFVRGGYLAEIDDVEEWAFLAKFLGTTKHKQPGYYVAGTRNARDNKWYWSRTGREVPISLQRVPNDPNGRASHENCLELRNDIHWNISHVECTVRGSFICELVTRG